MEKSALVHVWKGGHGLLAILGLVHFDSKSSWVQFLPQPPHLDSGEGTVWWGRARISSWGKVVENTEPHKKKKKEREDCFFHQGHFQVSGIGWASLILRMSWLVPSAAPL